MHILIMCTKGLQNKFKFATWNYPNKRVTLYTIFGKKAMFNGWYFFLHNQKITSKVWIFPISTNEKKVPKLKNCRKTFEQTTYSFTPPVIFHQFNNGSFCYWKLPLLICCVALFLIRAICTKGWLKQKILEREFFCFKFTHFDFTLPSDDILHIWLKLRHGEDENLYTKRSPGPTVNRQVLIRKVLQLRKVLIYVI